MQMQIGNGTTGSAPGGRGGRGRGSGRGARGGIPGGGGGGGRGDGGSVFSRLRPGRGGSANKTLILNGRGGGAAGGGAGASSTSTTTNGGGLMTAGRFQRGGASGVGAGVGAGAGTSNGTGARLSPRAAGLVLKKLQSSRGSVAPKKLSSEALNLLKGSVFQPSTPISPTTTTDITMSTSSTSSPPRPKRVTTVQIGSQNVTNEDRAARFATTAMDKYNELKRHREVLRKKYIREGKIADPSNTQTLAKAIQLVGECEDMCPEFERYEREIQMGLDRLEKIPGTEQVDHEKAVKRFRRSAAGDEEPLPCDVRPPHILIKTLDYLIHDVLANHGLEDSYAFVRDRARAIRKDFVLQHSRGLEAVECHERIARYHIMCCHELCDNPNVSLQQEHEQMRKTLQSLREYYRDLAKENIFSPNEAEFQAYYILSHIFQNDVATKSEQLRPAIFLDPQVQLALDFQMMIQRNNEFSRGHPRTEGSLNNYVRFFRCIQDSTRVSYLFACLLHMSFVSVRRGALKAMQKAYYNFPDNLDSWIAVGTLVQTLGFDDEEEAVENLDYYGIPYRVNPEDGVAYAQIGKVKTMVGGKVKMEAGAFIENQPVSFAPRRSNRLVASKRESFDDVDIVDGKASFGALPTLYRAPPKQSTVPPAPVRRPQPITSSLTPAAARNAFAPPPTSVAGQSIQPMFGGTDPTTTAHLPKRPPAPPPVVAVNVPPTHIPLGGPLTPTSLSQAVGGFSFTKAAELAEKAKVTTVSAGPPGSQGLPPFGFNAALGGISIPPPQTSSAPAFSFPPPVTQQAPPSMPVVPRTVTSMPSSSFPPSVPPSGAQAGPSLFQPSVVQQEEHVPPQRHSAKRAKTYAEVVNKPQTPGVAPKPTGPAPLRTPQQTPEAAVAATAAAQRQHQLVLQEEKRRQKRIAEESEHILNSLLDTQIRALATETLAQQQEEQRLAIERLVASYHDLTTSIGEDVVSSLAKRVAEESLAVAWEEKRVSAWTVREWRKAARLRRERREREVSERQKKAVNFFLNAAGLPLGPPVAGTISMVSAPSLLEKKELEGVESGKRREEAARKGIWAKMGGMEGVEKRVVGGLTTADDDLDRSLASATFKADLVRSVAFQRPLDLVGIVAPSLIAKAVSSDDHPLPPFENHHINGNNNGGATEHNTKAVGKKEPSRVNVGPVHWKLAVCCPSRDRGGGSEGGKSGRVNEFAGRWMRCKLMRESSDGTDDGGVSSWSLDNRKLKGGGGAGNALDTLDVVHASNVVCKVAERGSGGVVGEGVMDEGVARGCGVVASGDLTVLVQHVEVRRRAQYPLKKNAQCLCSGPNACLFQFSVFNEDDEDRREYWDCERERLYSFLSCLPAEAKVPLLMVFWPSPGMTFENFTDEFPTELNASSFLDHGPISSIEAMEIPISEFTFDEEEGRRRLQEGVKWLAGQGLRTPPKMHASIFDELINGHTSKDFNFMLRKVSNAFGVNGIVVDPHLHIQAFNLLADAFNTQLNATIWVLTHPLHQAMAWPAKEFSIEGITIKGQSNNYPSLPSCTWNSAERFREIERRLGIFRMPRMEVAPDSNGDENGDVEGLLRCLRETTERYMTNLIQSAPHLPRPTLRMAYMEWVGGLVGSEFHARGFPFTRFISSIATTLTTGLEQELSTGLASAPTAPALPAPLLYLPELVGEAAITYRSQTMSHFAKWEGEFGERLKLLQQQQQNFNLRPKSVMVSSVAAAHVQAHHRLSITPESKRKREDIEDGDEEETIMDRAVPDSPRRQKHPRRDGVSEFFRAIQEGMKTLKDTKAKSQKLM
ncbi:hypothetical protein HK102_010152 [Quaeritorhiza haematococci]|nr:hypothetical protein HK102_010152 [Quaeritorhiza haematococci]